MGSANGRRRDDHRGSRRSLCRAWLPAQSSLLTTDGLRSACALLRGVLGRGEAVVRGKGGTMKRLLLLSALLAALGGSSATAGVNSNYGGFESGAGAIMCDQWHNGWVVVP